MNVDRARELMNEWVASSSLRTHMEAVAACMGAYARRLDPSQVERWMVCGLLHDFDYERHPTSAEHPFVGVKELERLGVDEEIRTAILGHGDHTGVPRTSAMALALYACDELAGFIVACCKVRPDGIGDLEPKSVRKKLKDKAFAANVSREDVARGIADFAPVCGAEPAAFEDEHIRACIGALRTERARLGI